MTAFIILAVLLTLQSVLSLRGGFQFLRFLRRSQQRLPGPYHPPAAVIIPCKGLSEDLEQNAIKFLTQVYPQYQVIFAVASASDPAHDCLSRLARQTEAAGPGKHRKCALAVAGYSDTCGEKVNNLLAGLKSVDAEAQVLVFADIDAQPGDGWLRALVAPLKDSKTTISTGFRWYLPGPRFASRLRAAWDSSVATMMGEHTHNFAWGGSMAIRREEFRRLRVAEEYWQGTVSDDYAITRAVHDAGGAIRFEPRCLVASRNELGLRGLLTWANRQIIITRVYNARYWALGVASFGLYGVTFVWGIALIACSASAVHRIAAIAFLAAITALGMVKGGLRTVAAKEILPQEKDNWARYGACYWQLAPLVPWVMLFNFALAGFVRRIEWCGTVYELLSLNKLKIIRRSKLL
ncbi:MAG: glycosyltransferase [Terriglobia bacterium]